MKVQKCDANTAGCNQTISQIVAGQDADLGVFEAAKGKSPKATDVALVDFWDEGWTKNHQKTPIDVALVDFWDEGWTKQ